MPIDAGPRTPSGNPWASRIPAEGGLVFLSTLCGPGIGRRLRPAALTGGTDGGPRVPSPASITSSGRRLGSMVLSVGLTVGTLAGLSAGRVSAYSVCDPGGDVCAVYPDSVQSPLGLVTVDVSATNVVTVHLDAIDANTLVIGIPWASARTPRSPGFLADDHRHGGGRRRYRHDPGSARATGPACRAESGDHLDPSARSVQGHDQRDDRGLHPDDPAGPTRLSVSAQRAREH